MNSNELNICAVERNIEWRLNENVTLFKNMIMEKYYLKRVINF